MRRLRPLTVVGLVVVLLAAACACESEPVGVGGMGAGGMGAGSGGVIRAAGAAGLEQVHPLRVRLSPGAAAPGETSPDAAVVEGEPLGEAEIRAVTDRLPPWGDAAAGGVEFNRPPESRPPPRTGETIEHRFPAGPVSQAPSVDPGPLEVLRVQPTGEVGIAPFVSITFNQPMVPLATLAQLDALDVPATVTPALPGRWQWIGTRTLRFEHDPQILDRLPMATTYEVAVPAGTKSQAGKALARQARFTFETPAPQMQDFSPQDDSLDLQPVFWAAFDQRIQPSAALEAVTLLVSGQEQAIRLATDAEIEADEDVKRRIGHAADGTWLAFRPAAPLDADSPVEIRVGPHVPSAEGPNTSAASSIVRGRTYGPLRISEAGCQPSTYKCYPGYGLDVRFNNILDASTLDAAQFSITPQLADAVIAVSGRWLEIRGRTAGDTVYEVVIPATLGDEFGQTLAEPQKVEFTVEEAHPLLGSPGGEFATVDPLSTSQTVPVIVRRWDRLRVRLYRVEPADFRAFRGYVEDVEDVNQRWYRSRPDVALPAAPWPLIAEAKIDTGVDHDGLVEVPIDLSPALRGRHGHVVAVVEGVGELTTTADRLWDSRPVVMWVQDTDIGLDLIDYQEELVVWTTDLRSGDPLPGVEIRLEGAAESVTTDADGLARTAAGSELIELATAKLGADEALLPIYVRGERQDDQTIWYTADDRGMYRPGDTLNLKGWVRNLDLSGAGGLEFLPEGEMIAYEVYDPFGNRLGTGTTRLDRLGGFHLEVGLSEQSNLGTAWIEFSGPHSRPHTHYFQIQEFRRPEFEVATRTVASGPYFTDQPAELAVEAKYFSGGPLPDAEVVWTVTTRQDDYSPPGWGDFTFGVWRPWWQSGDYWPGEPWVEPEWERLAGRTDSRGAHVLRIDFEGDGDQLPSMVTAQAEVVDVNRQRWASSTDLLVHSGRHYVGLRSARAFVKAGDGLVIEAVVTDVDGNAVAGRPVEMTASRIVYQFADELAVQVELVSVAERTEDDATVVEGAPPRPAFATGQVTLRVPPLKRVLEVAAVPASATAEPGSPVTVEVEVTDAEGAPVEGADVLVMVVDEAVLALSGYELLDPIDIFYRPWGAYLGTHRGRGLILLEAPSEPAEGGGRRSRVTPASAESLADADDAALDEADHAAEANFGGSAADGSGGPRIDVRVNLDALALFDPKAVTGAEGRVTVEFDLPDSLTRYRVMAAAAADAERFGSAESVITARLPLQVRPSAPRFLNFGDEFELPVVVQNQTDAPMDVDVVVEASNLQLLGSPGRRVAVPANDRVEVRFPARTTSPGEARLRSAAVSGGHADAQVVALPVYTPATSEAFAAYGVVDEGAVFQPIAAPTGVIPQFGGLEVNTSSTALQALTDAVLYLADYRYASSDAYASRILAIAALRDVLGAFEAEGLGSPDELDAAVRRDIAELSALHNYDGGFGWWSRRAGSNPYASIQAMHALLTARRSGFTVSEEVIESGIRYLETIDDHIPGYYGPRAKEMLEAYALHVRALAGDQDFRAARSLWERRGADLGLDALAWIWPLVDHAEIEAEIQRVFNNRAVETAGAATFATDYGDDAYLVLHSDRRTDGIVLDALIAMAPESDLIPKVVAGLLGHQIKGRWNNVQENSFILLALDRYFDAFEASDPDFIARVWLGDLYAAQHTFAGRSIDRASTLVPMAELLAVGDSDLIVHKHGQGRLYYRVGLRYAPDDLDLEALDRGFVVQRSYEAVDDPEDVRLDAEGVWHVRAGAQVRVNLTMVNDGRRTNMVLVDPMPAGFEPHNPAVAVAGEIGAPRRDAGGAWWRWTWYEHQNLRDDRAEAFSSYLWAGTHEYSYVARATTPGTFVVPPAKAEEIYAPDVFGRSSSNTVVVHDRR